MKILFVVGPHASGKTYFMKKFLDNKFIFLFDTGPQMRKLHKENAPDISIKEWITKLEERYGMMITNEILYKQFCKEYDGTENVIMTGFRELEGIQYMINRLNPDQYEILYIDATFELLKENYQTREKVIISNDEFCKIIKEEEESGLIKIREYVLKNNSYTKYILKKKNSDFINFNIF